MGHPIAAVIQMNSTAEVADNLRQARRLLEQAAVAGVKLAALPENFAIMGQSEQDKLRVAEAMGQGPIQSWLRQTARELDIWIVAGTVPLKLDAEARAAAACLVVDAHGECVARYDKIHLFDVDVPATAERPAEVYRESATLAPGREPVVLDTPVGRLGLGICYDMRFPELFRQMVAQGAQLFCIPAAFTVPTGKAHWEVLLRARAIENLCYVLAPAQVGLHANGRDTYGHSMIVNAWGEVLGCQAQQPGVVTAPLDLDQLAELRRRFPVLTHRRL